MIVSSRNPFDVDKAKAYLDKLLSKDCFFELKELKPKRSNRQNAYLHLLIGYFAAIYGCSFDEAKVDFYKRASNRELFEVEITNSKGKTIKVLRSSATLDTREMNLSIERFRNWASAVAEIYLPSPDEEQFLNFCRQQIEANGEYI